MHAKALAGLAVVAALAACGQSPSLPLLDDHARFDGGMIYGGGLVVGVPSVPEEGATLTADGVVCDGRDGGFTYGGGGVTQGGMTLGGGLHTSAPCPEETP